MLHIDILHAKMKCKKSVPLNQFKATVANKNANCIIGAGFGQVLRTVCWPGGRSFCGIASNFERDSGVNHA
jgi:hypothetical protein